MMQLVWIDVPGGGFAATVNLGVDSLNPDAMPSRLEGCFLAYGADADNNERIVHATRRNDATDPVMYFNSAFRDGYRFKMESELSDHFSAELIEALRVAASAGV